MTGAPVLANGEVVGLFLLQRHAEMPLPVESATALVGRGLAGDLHSGRQGGKRQVLIVEAGDLESLGLAPGDLREQVSVRLPGLMSLPSGTRLEMGEAVLETVRDCEPCTHIGSLLGKQDREAFREQLVGRRGMLAAVVGVRGEGRIAVGQSVETVASPGQVTL